MAKQLILAVAGAGKTRTICRRLDPARKNLLLAFTHENIKNLHQELKDAFGGCPELTDVMTFHSFVHRFVVRPYLPSILASFPQSRYPAGMTMQPSPAQSMVTPSGAHIKNPVYATKDTWEHYVNRGNRLYCDTLCELAMAVKEGKRRLVDRIASGINRCYDHVAIDEFQDFREFEYEVMLGLADGLDDVVLVGDYYQHSVAAHSNSGKPFSGRKGTISYGTFVQAMEKHGFRVDSESLSKSRRCSPEICEFVSRKLNIPIQSAGVSTGHVHFVADKELKGVLENPEIVKLLEKNAEDQPFSPCNNWSYSKGDTYGRVCVILTDPFSKIGRDGFSIQDKTQIAVNKLYVALTRTKGDLLLVTKTQFDCWKSSQSPDRKGQLLLNLFGY